MNVVFNPSVFYTHILLRRAFIPLPCPHTPSALRVACHTALLLHPQQQLGRQVAVLPQDELAAFRSIPALCLSSGSDGLCSARDFHNNKVCSADFYK